MCLKTNFLFRQSIQIQILLENLFNLCIPTEVLTEFQISKAQYNDFKKTLYTVTLYVAQIDRIASSFFPNVSDQVIFRAGFEICQVFLWMNVDVIHGTKRLHMKELSSRPAGLSFRGLDGLSSCWDNRWQKMGRKIK